MKDTYEQLDSGDRDPFDWLPVKLEDAEGDEYTLSNSGGFLKVTPEMSHLLFDRESAEELFDHIARWLEDNEWLEDQLEAEELKEESEGEE